MRLDARGSRSRSGWRISGKVTNIDFGNSIWTSRWAS